jgi:hypothetical protein
MTLSAFAEVGAPTASPKAITAAASKEPNEVRMSFPEMAPGLG